MSIDSQTSVSIQPRTSTLKLRKSFDFHNFSSIQGLIFTDGPPLHRGRALDKVLAEKKAVEAENVRLREQVLRLSAEVASPGDLQTRIRSEETAHHRFATEGRERLRSHFNVEIDTDIVANSKFVCLPKLRVAKGCFRLGCVVSFARAVRQLRVY